MANSSPDDDNVTVSKIYETLKSGPYLKKLYWDVLSDIKEKKTFKQMRATTEKLLNKKSEYLANLPDCETDNNLEMKTIVAEICSMTYAIDTVYSKILFIKLQKEFKSHIIDAIIDLRREKKIPDSVWSKLANDPALKCSGESSTTKSVTLPKQPEIPSRPVRIKRPRLTSSDLETKNREIRSEIHKDLKAINSEEKKIDSTSKNSKTENQAAPKKQTSGPNKKSTKRKKTEDQVPSNLSRETKNTEITKDSEIARKTDIALKTEGTQNKGVSQNVEVTQNTDVTEGIEVDKEMHTGDLDSDAESEISVGEKSIASVSSVHTSDLSSFDDEISLSSEDEVNGSKKKLSLSELKRMYSNGQLPERFNSALLKNIVEKFKTPPKKKKTTAVFKEQMKTPPKKKNSAAISKEPMESPSSSADNAPDSADSSTESKSSTPKVLPKRIRKPNSKYSSENILCSVTMMNDRRKLLVAAAAENEKNLDGAKQQLNVKRARNDMSDSDEDPHSKIVKAVPVKEKNETKSTLISLSKETPVTSKPQFAVRSLTSRKTAPLTLFST